MKKKKIYVFLVIFFVVCIALFNFSYSYYKELKENRDAIFLEVLDFAYTITSPALVDNQITIESRSTVSLSLQVSSENTTDSKYELYYQVLGSLTSTELSNIIVECNENVTSDYPTGSILSSDTKVITVEIVNNNDFSITVSFDCQGGFINQDLVLEQGNSIPVVSKPLGRDLVELVKAGAVLDNTRSTYVSDSRGIDFGSVSSDRNGKGVYIFSSTENDEYPIYYYRGDVNNNNIKFANFCWKIVRTTETGGIKLIYNGTPDRNGDCTASGRTSMFSDYSSFNSTSTDNAYVGYMYGRTGASNYSTTHQNSRNSTIKQTVESWYRQNLVDYTDMLEDTIWCNDRSINSRDEVGSTGVGTNITYYGADTRLYVNNSPSLTCSNTNDRFTVSSENGNGKLTYPIALLTADEVVLSGSVYDFDGVHTNYYLYNQETWWTLTPGYFDEGDAWVLFVDWEGYVFAAPASYGEGVRPAISLKNGTQVELEGDGTSSNPYVVLQ